MERDWVELAFVLAGAAWPYLLAALLVLALAGRVLVAWLEGAAAMDDLMEAEEEGREREEVEDWRKGD